MDRKDIENFDAIMNEKKVKAEAHMMMLDMLSEILPEEMKPMFELPKLCHKAAEKIGDLLLVAKEFDNFDDGSKYAIEACAFLARVNEDVEAFIEQSSPSKSKESSDFDQM